MPNMPLHDIVLFSCEDHPEETVFWTLENALEKGSPVCDRCGGDMIQKRTVRLKTKKDMTTQKITREDAARFVENDIKKLAGVLRNLILEGETSLEEMLKNKRAQFWIEAVRSCLEKMEK